MAGSHSQGRHGASSSAARTRARAGKVTRVLADEDRVVVEGINLVKRHMRPNAAQPAGRHRRAGSSRSTRRKVMPVDPKTGKGTRVRSQTLENGNKVRVAVKSGEKISAC